MAEMNENHEAYLVEMEATHNDTLATLREEHDRTVKSRTQTHPTQNDKESDLTCVVSDLKMAHEQQRKSLEEEFEKIRLSLQVKATNIFLRNNTYL